jgi:hypothetical protein
MRYRAARNLIRGRPSISVRQQTGNRNEWPLSGRLTLPGNGEEERKAVINGELSQGALRVDFESSRRVRHIFRSRTAAAAIRIMLCKEQGAPIQGAVAYAEPARRLICRKLLPNRQSPRSRIPDSDPDSGSLSTRSGLRPSLC